MQYLVSAHCCFRSRNRPLWCRLFSLFSLNSVNAVVPLWLFLWASVLPERHVHFIHISRTLCAMWVAVYQSPKRTLLAFLQNMLFLMLALSKSVKRCRCWQNQVWPCKLPWCILFKWLCGQYHKVLLAVRSFRSHITFLLLHFHGTMQRRALTKRPICTMWSKRCLSGLNWLDVRVLLLCERSWNGVHVS